MTGLHFYLEKRNIVSEKVLNQGCPVILSFSYSSFRIKVYTGRKIPEAEWDKKAERVKPVFSKSEEFNGYLNLLSERVEKYFSEILEQVTIPDPVRFKSEIKRMVNSRVFTFFDLLIHFIEENNRNWRPSTYKKMKTFYSQLKEFSSDQKDVIMPGTVNQEFADKLITFYNLKGLKDTSIKKNLDLLKWFMNWCLRKELIFSREYVYIRFSPGINIERDDDIFLKWEEIISFYKITGLTKKEEWCRDIFCFIAFSGLRFSRISRLGKDSVIDGYIQTSELKKEKVLLNRFSYEISKKYENRYYKNNTLFPFMSLITFHRHLRSAALKAKLNRILFARASYAVHEHLHKKISAQTAINTYYANSVRLDIPDEINSFSDSAKSRIRALAGVLKLSEKKQLATSEALYDSI